MSRETITVDKENMIFLLGYLHEKHWRSAFYESIREMHDTIDDDEQRYGPMVEHVRDLAVMVEERYSGCMEVSKLAMEACSQFAKDEPDSPITKQMLSEKYEIKEAIEKVQEVKK